MRTRGFFAALLIASLASIACDDTRPVTDAGTDVRTDSAPAQDVAMDTGSDAMSGDAADTGDAAPMDVVTEDAPAQDVPIPEDAMASCMSVGDACSESNACIAESHDCYTNASGGFCAPSRPRCGGFTQAGCTDGTASNCLRVVGTDYGVCVTNEEKECLCNSSASSIIQRGDEGCPATS